MLRLNHYIIALVLWLCFLFNIERLDLSRPDAFNIASSIYVVAVIMVMLGIWLPHWRRVPLWRLLVIAAASFLVAAFVNERPDWGGAYTYLASFELIAVLISVTLGHMVGYLSADFIATVRALMFSEMDDRVYSLDRAEGMIKREMQYSRRMSRPLSVMVLDAEATGSPGELQATAQEIQGLLVKRHRLVALTRIMARTLRRTDFVLDQTAEGRLVLVMPEMRQDQADAIINRLTDRAQQRLGLHLRYGVASFPEQGVTFEELLYQAEQSLHPKYQYDRRTDSKECGSATTDKLTAVETEKLPVMETR